MQTLSYGFVQPEATDKGAPLFTALEQNIQQLNDHNHDGQNSAPISATAVAGAQAQLDPAQWATYGGPVGHYRPVVTMAPGFLFDVKNISVRTAAGAYVAATIEKRDDTSFFIYSTDNTQAFRVVYGG